MSETMNESVNEWGILELLGHRRLGGRVTEVEKFGSKMARIDIPDTTEGAAPDAVVATQFYASGAIYGFTPCTEAVARAEARWSQPRPVALLSPAQAETPDEHDEHDDGDDNGDGNGAVGPEF